MSNKAEMSNKIEVDYQRVVNYEGSDKGVDMVCHLFAKCQDCPRNDTYCEEQLTVERVKEAFEKQPIEIQREHAAYVKARMEEL